MKPKLSDSKIAEIRRLRDKGDPVAEIVKKTGVSKSAVYDLLKEETPRVQPEAPKAAAPVASPHSASVSLEALASVGLPPGTGGPKPGAGGTVPPVASGGTGGAQPAPAPGAVVTGPEAAAEALITLCDAMSVTACRVQASRLKVKVTPKMIATWKLTGDEKASLRSFAPAAAPYLLRVLQHSDKIAAGVFGVLYWAMISARFAAIKDSVYETKKEDKK